MKMRITVMAVGLILLISGVSARYYNKCQSRWACGYSDNKDLARGTRLERDDITFAYPSYVYPMENHTGGSNANDYYPDDFSKGHTKGYMTRIEQIQSPLVV